MEKNIIATFGGSEHVSNDPGYVGKQFISYFTDSFFYLPSEKCLLEGCLGKLQKVFFKLVKPISLKLILLEGLKEYFSKFGVVSEAMVMRDPTTKHSR